MQLAASSPEDSSDDVVRLFAEVVPELASGIVQIMAIARVPKRRTKIALATTDGTIDPIAVCLGPGAKLIRNIVDNLQGERIDLILWSEDPARFIASALAPVSVERIDLDPALKHAVVVVKPRDLNKALGREGENRDLVSRLSGWQVDVVPNDAA